MTPARKNPAAAAGEPGSAADASPARKPLRPTGAETTASSVPAGGLTRRRALAAAARPFPAS